MKNNTMIHHLDFSLVSWEDHCLFLLLFPGNKFYRKHRFRNSKYDLCQLEFYFYNLRMYFKLNQISPHFLTHSKAELKTAQKDWMMLFTSSGIMQWARPQLCLVVMGTCMESLDLLIMERWVVWAQGMEPVFFQPTDIHSW